MDVLEEIKDADEAFLSAMEPKDINGIKLEPFSLMRQAIAEEIGGLNTETAFFHAVIRIWVCTLKPMDCVKAKRNKDQSVIDAFAWADVQGLSQNNKHLIELYRRMNEEVSKSSNVVNDDGDEPSKNSGGPLES